MARKIYVWAKQPGSPARHVYISNSLENLQKYVGGYIEAVTLTTDSAIICNEEGRIRNMDFNVDICGYDFYGPIIFVGVKDEDFADYPVDDIKVMKQMFPELWEPSEVNYGED